MLVRVRVKEEGRMVGIEDGLVRWCVRERILLGGGLKRGSESVVVSGFARIVCVWSCG